MGGYGLPWIEIGIRTVILSIVTALAMIQLATTRNDKKGEQMAREVLIFSDSQAAIQAIQNPQRPSGQYVLSLINNHVTAIRSNKTHNITIRWIPAHVDWLVD
jgi:ribonuclease HI